MRVALVTGSAGGLGQALTAALESDGWTVAASDLPDTGAPFEADLREAEACRHLVQQVLAEHSRLDLLVNNAATMYHGPLDLADLDRWWDTISVNLSAPFRLSRAASAELHRTRGQIINMASIMASAAEPGFSAYCASKSGLVGLTKALARELAPHVRVNAIAPGHIDTPQQAIDAEVAGITREELYDSYARIMPVGRILTPGEVARLAVFLSNETGFTGSCVHLNGGLLMV
jgi:NAD(P)-dependent dehydrogenase (short-subunit alcohol dehydrogenase family)